MRHYQRNTKEGQGIAAGCFFVGVYLCGGLRNVCLFVCLVSLTPFSTGMHFILFFVYLLCLLFVGFIQFQEFMWVLKHYTLCPLMLLP